MSKRTNEFPVIESLTDADTVTGVQGNTLDVNVPVGLLKAHINTIADAGSYFPTDTVEAALQQLGSTQAAAPGAYQPIDSDLTAIAALTTTAFGRNLLTLVDGTGVLTAIGAQPLDSDLSAIATLTTLAYGRSLLTVANADGALALLGAQPAARAAKVTHPNTDDTLVEVWDVGLGRWQGVHYDSGNRRITTFINGWTAGSLTVRRINHIVYINGQLTGAPTFANPWVIPAGFRGTNVPGGFSGVGKELNATGAPMWYGGKYDNLFTDGGMLDGRPWAANYYFTGSVNFPTDDPIPTALPGTLLSPTALPADEE